MLSEFALTVLYTQIIGFVTGLARPGLLWTDAHVAQGFATSPGIACFGVPDHDGKCLLRISTAARVSVDPASLWAVQVPFEVPASPLKVGTIGNVQDVTVPPGRYNLTFQALPSAMFSGEEMAFVLKLEFCSDSQPDFAILKKGTELTTDVVLRRDAQHG